jgi:hypothetical protein
MEERTHPPHLFSGRCFHLMTNAPLDRKPNKGNHTMSVVLALVAIVGWSTTSHWDRHS